MKKILLNNVCLVTVSSIHINDTIDALMHNLKGVEFKSVKFITHEKPKKLPSEIEYHKCKKITNLDEYSKFMLYHLHEYIDALFCLTIHRDGVILNPKKWRNEFLDYDYIGSPWPIDKAFKSPGGVYERVGNGGFSLRSKRLLEIASEENIPFVPNENGCNHEDVLICVTYKHIFEKKGMKFAGIDVAKYFAHELRVPEIKGIKPFGFHQYKKQNKWYPRFPEKKFGFFNLYLFNFKKPEFFWTL